MTRTIKSQTGNTHYFLTIDEQKLEATDCTCGDRHFRHHVCKHITGFDAQLLKTLAFIALKNLYDVHSAQQQAARREAYCVDFAIYG